MWPAMPRPLSMLVWLKPDFEVSQSPSTSLIHSGLSAVLAMSRTIVRLEVPYVCTLSWATASFEDCDHPFQSVTKVDGFVSSMAEIGTLVVVDGAARRAASAWII